MASRPSFTGIYLFSEIPEPIDEVELLTVSLVALKVIPSRILLATSFPGACKGHCRHVRLSGGQREHAGAKQPTAKTG